MIATLLLILIYISFISLGLPDSLLGSAWPSMYGGLAVPISYAGIVYMLISFSTVASSLMSGKIIKRFGTGKVTVVSVLMTATALLGMSVSNSFVTLCVLAIPLGLGGGSVDAALNNYVALRYKARHMSWLHCFWGIGAATGPIIMSYSLHSRNAWNSWQSGYLTVGSIQFVLAVILVLSLPLWKKAGAPEQDTEDAGGKSLTMIELLRLPGVVQALGAFFCYCAIESTAGLWGSSFLVLIKGISAETAASWISLYYFGITLGRFLSGFLTAKLNGRQSILLGHGLIAAGVALLLLPVGGILLPAGFFLIGLGCAPIFPSMLHDTPKNFGKAYSQEIMGIQMACAYVGSSVMPPIFGMLASLAGYSLFPIYLAVLLFVMLIMTLALGKKVSAA